MDCKKVGNLIFELRKENKMTQKQLADKMNISDKTISKWERGLGCPDVSLLHELSDIFNVNIEKILLGDLEPNEFDGGNMKKTKLYVCPDCGNILTSTSEAEVSCCGRRLKPLSPAQEDQEHQLNFQIIDGEYYITFSHEMTKSHYISFVAYISYDRFFIVKLYPEQNGEIRFPILRGGKLYFFCNQHGLILSNVKKGL